MKPGGEAPKLLSSLRWETQGHWWPFHWRKTHHSEAPVMHHYPESWVMEKVEVGTSAGCIVRRGPLRHGDICANVCIFLVQSLRARAVWFYATRQPSKYLIRCFGPATFRRSLEILSPHWFNHLLRFLLRVPWRNKMLKPRSIPAFWTSLWHSGFQPCKQSGRTHGFRRGPWILSSAASTDGHTIFDSLLRKKRKAPEKIRQVGLSLVKSCFNELTVNARCLQVTALPRISRPMAWSGK